jgi:hypothetical protein
MRPDEIAGFGPLLHRLVPAVKAATGVERVYYLALMERAAHFHLWLVPKKDDGDLRGVAYMAALSDGLAERGRSDVAEDPS